MFSKTDSRRRIIYVAANLLLCLFPGEAMHLNGFAAYGYAVIVSLCCGVDTNCQLRVPIRNIYGLSRYGNGRSRCAVNMNGSCCGISRFADVVNESHIFRNLFRKVVANICENGSKIGRASCRERV